eukprot:COSAG04_NODE_23336_length_340_cov_0.846473_1_plen_28_part_10
MSEACCAVSDHSGDGGAEHLLRALRAGA